jgi:hypothetical protein
MVIEAGIMCLELMHRTISPVAACKPQPDFLNRHQIIHLGFLAGTVVLGEGDLIW